jgi:hypothetical protein
MGLEINSHLSQLNFQNENIFSILGRSRHRREGNIRMDLKEIGINTRKCVGSALEMEYWRALLNAALNLRVPKAMEFVS